MKRSWTYTLGGNPLPEPVEITEGPPEGLAAEAHRAPVFTDRYMEGVRSPIDGADIGSRAKRRAYMKEKGLVDAGDYKGFWAEQAQRREEFRRTGEDGRPWEKRFSETYERMQHERTRRK